MFDQGAQITQRRSTKRDPIFDESTLKRFSSTGHWNIFLIYLFFGRVAADGQVILKKENYHQKFKLVKSLFYFIHFHY